MIEKVILDYINGEIPAYMEHLFEGPGEYYVIEKTGSSTTNHITTSTIAIQSYADSLYRAAVLNDELKTKMEKAVELDSIGAVYLNSDYNYTDTDFKKYRYQAVFDITHY